MKRNRKLNCIKFYCNIDFSMNGGSDVIRKPLWFQMGKERIFQNNKGLTLMDVIISIGIFSMVAILILPNITMFDRTNEETIKANATQLASEVFQFYMKENKYPVGREITNISDIKQAVPFIHLALSKTSSKVNEDVKIPPNFLERLILAHAIKEIDPSIMKGVGNRIVNVKEYFIIDKVENLDDFQDSHGFSYKNELAGFIFSKKSFNSKDGRIYNALYKK